MTQQLSKVLFGELLGPELRERVPKLVGCEAAVSLEDRPAVEPKAKCPTAGAKKLDVRFLRHRYVGYCQPNRFADLIRHGRILYRRQTNVRITSRHNSRLPPTNRKNWSWVLRLL